MIIYHHSLANMEDDESHISSAKGVSSDTATDEKKRRRQYNVERAKTRIYLYEQFVPWRSLRDQMNLEDDEKLAEFLINNYLSSSNKSTRY